MKEIVSENFINRWKLWGKVLTTTDCKIYMIYVIVLYSLDIFKQVLLDEELKVSHGVIIGKIEFSSYWHV